MINHYKYEAHQNMLPVICQGLATKVMHSNLKPCIHTFKKKKPPTAN